MRDVMSRPVVTLRPGDSLQKAARLFRQVKHEGLPVVGTDGRLIGLMSKANLYDAVAAGMGPDTPVTDIFTRDVVTVNENMPYDKVAEAVRTSRVGAGVVLNDRNEVVGMFNKADWIKAMFKKEALLNCKLQAVIDTMHNGLIAVDGRGMVTTFNRAAEKIFSIASCETIGKPVGMLMPGIELNGLMEAGQVAIGIKHVQGELSLLCNITPVLVEGRATGAIIAFQDLTDLENIVSELESVTKLYETLLLVMEMAYDGIIVVDQAGCITLVNRPAAEFFRRRVEDMVGKPAPEVIDNTRLHVVARTGVAEINQLQFIGGIPYVVSSLPIMRQGRVIGAVGKILFRHLEEVKVLANKLAAMDQQLKFYKSRTYQGSTDRVGFSQIITADVKFNIIKNEAEIAARGISNIFITGESGTGKDLLAQAIHQCSPRRGGPFVRINCAAIPENLLESEFFGYAPGAFTGAQRGGKRGKLAIADGGTLFLDEIGDMSLNLQGKLLRVLQDRSFEPVGSNQTVRVDIRFVAATNKDIDLMIQKSLFRSDLYYRLNVISLHIPPLRDRREDIILLMHYFLDKYNRIFGANITDISAGVRQILLGHDWPGNVRELENVVERAINFAHGSRIEVEDLPLYLREKDHSLNRGDNQFRRSKMFRACRESAEREVIVAALGQTNGNKAEAARILGVSRSWLYEMMSRTGLSCEKN
jgi:transcriptional regulator with PAS, ATPase and Fis domain